MEHLSLEIFDLPTVENPRPTGSKFAVLPEDATITIVDTSEVFASGDVWSHSFTLNVVANAHIFGTSGEIHGSRLHEQIHKRRARLWVEGLPLYLGYLTLGDEAEVDAEGNVDVGFESGQKTFEEMIEGAKANQVPMMGDVRIGVALWRKRWTRHRIKLSADCVYNVEGYPCDVLAPDGGDEIEITCNGENDETPLQEYPRMVFPKGEFESQTPGVSGTINDLNTDAPYTEDGNGTPTHPFCNIALCYQKYGYEKKNENGDIVPDYSSEPEAQRGYEYMPANRVNSAPNFFVIYWLRSLMKHLGIHVDENQMMDVEDLRRLFFVNTKCAYKEPKHLFQSADDNICRYKFGSAGRLVAEQFGPYQADGETWFDTPVSIIDPKECKFEVTSALPEGVKRINVRLQEALSWTQGMKDDYVYHNSYLIDAFATSECFPNADISEVIHAIENGFGVRFVFDDKFQRVRIVLLRNIFRSREVQDMECDIIAPDVKVENNIRGFRMTYGNTEDTHFYYKGFADMLPHRKELWPDNSDTYDYSKWNLDARYADIIHQAAAFNKTCYVTPETGNAYGVKVDKNAKRYDDLHPAIFEYAAFMDAEDGDCTGEEETIHTIDMGFMPAIMNDLNMESELEGKSKQRFALFVDETMRPRRPDLNDGVDYNRPDAVYDVDNGLYKIATSYNIWNVYKYEREGMMSGGVIKPGEFSIASDMPVTLRNLILIYGVPLHKQQATIDIKGHINEGYRLYLQDNFEPNDTGVSPIETHDWGLTLGIMRGSGSDATVEYSYDPDDGEGNNTWDVVPGSSVTAHPDTCDSYGNLWDYGIEEGRKAQASELQEAGWDVDADADGAIPFTYHFFLDGIDFLCTPIKYRLPNERPYEDPVLTKAQLEYYVTGLRNQYGWNFAEHDAWKIILSAGEEGSGQTVAADGRFSLKLRAEKPNPYYVENSTEEDKKDQYLQITNHNLRRRGLCDQFYKEFSFWVRNARAVKRQVHIELAQLLALDKTKRVRVGDVTGFIRKNEYTVSNKTGLGPVTMEIMYI